MSEELGDRNENNQDGAEEESIPSEIIRYQQSDLTSSNTQDIIDKRFAEAAKDAPFEAIAYFLLESKNQQLQEKLIDDRIEQNKHNRAHNDKNFNFRAVAFVAGIAIGVALIPIETAGAFLIISLTLMSGLGIPAEIMPKIINALYGKPSDSEGKKGKDDK